MAGDLGNAKLVEKNPQPAKGAYALGRSAF